MSSMIPRGNIVTLEVLSVNGGTLSAVSANTTSEQTVTVPGLKVGDFVEVIKPTHQTGLSLGNCRVSAADTLAIQFINNTAGSLTPTASETYLVLVARADASRSNFA